jgi:hypothetical protein
MDDDPSLPGTSLVLDRTAETDDTSATTINKTRSPPFREAALPALLNDQLPLLMRHLQVCMTLLAGLIDQMEPLLPSVNPLPALSLLVKVDVLFLEELHGQIEEELRLSLVRF